MILADPWPYGLYEVGVEPSSSLTFTLVKFTVVPFDTTIANLT